MNVADTWSIMPLVILAGGSLLLLIFGAVTKGRYCTWAAVVIAICSVLWTIQSSSTTLVPILGMAYTPFTRFFTVFFALCATTILLLSLESNECRVIRGEEYPATILFATFGMTVVVSALNLLTLFLGLEALTFAFYILVAMDLNRAGSAEAGLKYLLLGTMAAAFIAFGIALIYAELGTLAITPALQGVLRQGAINPVALAGWGLLLSGLAFKVSLVPAHLWTPDVYQGGPTPVIAFLSTGSKVAAFAALFLLLPADGGGEILRMPFRYMAFFSMLVGNLAALRQENIKRMLAYSSIGQMGYVTLAFLTGSASGHMASLFYLVAYSVMNLAAFGAITSLATSEDLERIDDYRGIGYNRPFQAGVLALAMFALAGIPPTVGFTGKFMIFAAAIRGGELTLAITGIFTAAVSIYFYLRVVVNLYLRSPREPVRSSRATPVEGLTLCIIGLAILILGIFPSPLLDLIYEVLG